MDFSVLKSFRLPLLSGVVGPFLFSMIFIGMSLAVVNDLQHRHHALEKFQSKVAELNMDLGYVGLIHYFKNCVLRGATEREYCDQAIVKANRARANLREIRAVAARVGASLDIRPVEKMTSYYKANVYTVLRMHGEGAPISLIDKNVRHDTGPAAVSLIENLASVRQLLLTLIDRAYILVLAFSALAGVGLTILGFEIRRFLKRRVARTEANLRAVVETAADAILTIDQNGRVRSFNPAAEKLFGYTEDEILGRNLKNLIPDDALSEHSSGTTVQLPSGAQQFANVGSEVQGLCKDGGQFPAEVSIAEWVDNEGAVHFTSIIRDITERKRHEEHIELLMSEVNHRAKNLLTVIQSIVKQTAKSSEPDEFVENLGGRLHGLAVCQDLVIAGSWEAVGLADLITSQTEFLGADLKDRIELHGESMIVTPGAAQGIGLALHELMTNALKYGALSTPNGTVAIRWWTSKRETEVRFFMTWTERGGPPVREPTRRGFGHTVITRMTRYALQGDVDLKYEERGVSWKLNAPASQVVRDFPDNSSIKPRTSSSTIKNIKSLEAA